ncbi:formate/nitrite transporter family protein [Rhodohalobacter sp. SW132]|uniref:formate/nitrite transporter family protein n=1 Tax=Rhodohalobacter sp. SW132 TaxID=2293433 RepID=UPI000E22C70D|nr:formate/nitrite transporter family protein [Rhodohalobacter sp. SW132]REL39221.1 formate/nitrite transporter family protein [Rhodohalobacter sp. SW132]
MSETNANKTSGKSKTGPIDMEAYRPDMVARHVMDVGVKKTRYPIYKTLTLGLMGGAFISIGALYELFIMAHPEIDVGTALIIAPFFYAVGYIMAFISGAEIFTTNNLSAMGWASGKLSLLEISKNWSLVLLANLFGAMFIVTLFYFSGLANQLDNAFIETAKTISARKLSFGPLETMVIGIFGNLLICAGLWIAMAGRTVTDKFIALLVPVAAVPALNFQHSTGNMFQFFFALITEVDDIDLELPSEITFWSISSNLFFVSIGNIIGGGVMIAIIYYFVFIRETRFD